MAYSKWILAAALASAAVPATSAPVAPPTPATGKALILIPLTITKLNDLDFGSVIPSGVSGTVRIDPADGTRSVTGGVTGVPGDVGFRARFAGGGTANQQVIVVVTPPASLISTANSADTIPVMALTVDGSPIRTIDSTRAFLFGVGGILQINANQPEGEYQGTFDVTAVYL